MIRLEQLEFGYRRGESLLRMADFVVEMNDSVLLLGPSGCGKTTTLRMLAGLEEATGRDIYIGAECVNDIPTQRRDVAMVFQSYALYPHMTVAENIAYPLRVRQYRIRKGSGGRGRHKGGDGSIREIETLAPARMSLLSDRRRRAPYGLLGGEDGEVGRAFIVRTDGSEEKLTSKGSWDLKAGDRVRIETPSGGGFGKT